ncbi:MAG TPA: rhamnulokinase [Candidatus Faecalibacterium intestinigallinarum]|uniref:Rhamnulokinase n=1 Tax=Candidatus Faecalibacterium intestinigallinarum TaxID=2838581 RepID=A0A9D1QCB7_9FIRM|nr:rhamnulokinase [Candidatus Faecalibacterium intestinigallinarum]
MEKRYYLAVDIGASSGRHIVGWMEDGRLCTEEVYRFPNGVQRQDGHLVWDIEGIFAHVKEGLKAAFARYPRIESVSIDTWAVDYVLLDAQDQPVYPVYAYRDGRTQDAVGAVHGIVPFAQLYARTGIQFQPFNTIYQLYADKLAGRLDGAEDFLMVPEYLLWRLCGVKAREYTNATSTGLVNARTGQYDPAILQALGLPQRLFPSLTGPGAVLGELLPDVAAEAGGQCRVVLCATHDTASAVEGIPMAEGEGLFLSSGTWSLLGAKLPQPLTSEESCRANFTNEGGVGYIRYLKNIMGLWIVQCIQKQLGISFGEMVDLARTSGCDRVFDVNDPRFTAPADMKAEIAAALSETGPAPAGDADLIRSVYRSLAESYGKAVREMEAVTGRSWDILYIAGGGAKNALLNDLTARATGKRVIALPIEATAIGNLKVQMKIEEE